MSDRKWQKRYYGDGSADYLGRPLPLPIPLSQRGPLPETRPDTDAEEHDLLCRCEVCKRPAAKRWKRKKIRAMSA